MIAQYDCEGPGPHEGIVHEWDVQGNEGRQRYILCRGCEKKHIVVLPDHKGCRIGEVTLKPGPKLFVTKERKAVFYLPDDEAKVSTINPE